MIKKKQKARTNAPITKDVLDNALNKVINKLTLHTDNTVGKLAMSTDTAIGKLAIMIQNGFMEVNGRIDDLKEELGARITDLEKEMKGMHGNFDIVFQQLKEIREEIKEADTRADVVDLQIRVTKLEKKIKQ